MASLVHSSEVCVVCLSPLSSTDRADNSLCPHAIHHSCVVALHEFGVGNPCPKPQCGAGSPKTSFERAVRRYVPAQRWVEREEASWAQLTSPLQGEVNGAISSWREASALGHADSQYHLGMIYRYGRGLARNDMEAERLFSEAAHQGHARSKCELALLFDTQQNSTDQGKKRDCFSAIVSEHGCDFLFDEGCRRIFPIDQWVESGAGSWAQLTLNQKSQMEVGIRLWTAAAEYGHVYAQHNLGCVFRDGEGVDQNHKTAVRWFQQAADQGDASAMLDLGKQYEGGKGLPKNLEVAKRWFAQAAERGNPDAQHKLGLILAEKSDPKAAVRWLQMATDQGCVGAEYALGTMYRDGTGVPLNQSLSIKWLNSAAGKGHSHAQCALGNLYRQKGAFKEAVRYFQMAADQDNDDAIYTLGVMYAAGEGLPRNSHLAERELRGCSSSSQASAAASSSSSSSSSSAATAVLAGLE